MYVRVMADSVYTPSDPFGSALGTASGALAQLCEQPTWSIADAELPGLILAAQRLHAAVDELGCRLVAEADSRVLAAHCGGSSTTAWLDNLTGCGRSEAGQVTRTAPTGRPVRAGAGRIRRWNHFAGQACDPGRRGSAPPPP
jgi:hypothetical protein